MSGSAGASAPGGATGTGVTAAVVSGSTGDPLNPVYNTQKLAQSLDVLCINGFRWMKDVENVASSRKSRCVWTRNILIHQVMLWLRE
jgi:hypothetical protein